jgi:hypothetical protein
MKSAVAPPTRTAVPAGGWIARIAFTVSWLASETNGWAEIAWIAVTPPLRGCGGATSATPGIRPTLAAIVAAAFGPPPSTSIQIGVSW